MNIACVAGGIVDGWNNVLTAEPLKANSEAARRIGSYFAAKTLFRAPTIPPATQARINKKEDFSESLIHEFYRFYCQFGESGLIYSSMTGVFSPSRVRDLKLRPSSDAELFMSRT